MDTEWDQMVAMHNLFNPHWDEVKTGDVVSVVADCELHSNKMMVGLSVPDNRKLRIFGDVNFQVKGCRRLTLLDVTVDKVSDCVNLLMTDASVTVAHGLHPVTAAVRLVELCSGIACSGVGLSEVGFQHVASVEWMPPLARLHESCHPGVPVLAQDITAPSFAKVLLQNVDPPFSIMSGFSCQPYSTGGAQGGSSDDRSSTLPASIRTCFLCQCPIMFLECVAPARCNKFVQAHLRHLESQLGYHVSQITLRLEDVWASRRFRWWVVATHPSLGPVALPEWPKSPSLTVRDIMPALKTWDPKVSQLLELTSVEQEKFMLDGSHMRKYLVQKDGKLPTCLHSWGSQATSCPCGCRSCFSDALIHQRGIYAQLIQLPVVDGLVKYRHLHPVELGLLNGFIPPAAWLAEDHPDLRLRLCAVGQLASPLQALWVGGCAIQHLHQVFGLPPINPIELLGEYRRKLFQVAKDLFHDVPQSLTSSNMVEVRHVDDTVTRVQVSAQATLAHLCQTEFDLTQSSEGKWCDAHTHAALAMTELVAGRSIRVLPHDFDPGSESASAVVPLSLDDELLAELPLEFPAEASPKLASDASVVSGDDRAPAAAPPVDPSLPAGLVEPKVVPAGVPLFPAASVAPDVLFDLKNLNGAQLSALVPPLVRDLPSCRHMRQAVVSNVARLNVLHRQRSAMGDDEINLHIQACIAIAADPHTQYLDPLLATTWLKVGTHAMVADWLAQFPEVTRIVTVVHLQDHWVPIIWSKGLTDVRVSLWEHEEVQLEQLCPLHGLLSAAWGCSMFVLACNRRSYCRDYCGTAAVAFLAHQLIDAELPPTEAAVQRWHTSLRNSFAEAVHNMVEVPKPWMWGMGMPDVVALTASLLQVHGVPPAQTQARAKLVIQSLGKTEVQKAVTGVAPWKSLKALANLQSPPLQLVLPDEVAQKGMMKHSAKSAAQAKPRKPLPARPVDLDPAKLLLDAGAFCCGEDQPLNQIPFGSLGPLARGVALASFAEAVPFLQSGKLLTHQGLAMLVIQPPAEVETALQWSTIRFAVRCSVNQEPMLLSGLLVQLGQQPVYQFRAKDALAVPVFDVACARITVYQDQLELPWEEFANKPVKHIVSVLPCLQTCRKPACSCPCWHPEPDQPQDPLLDVFRRQYFNDAGRPVKWDRASHFAVLIRYAKPLEKLLLEASGQKGLYIEPKTEDALKPHPDYQVIWLSQMDFAAVAHVAQCEIHCIGLARAGRRYGIRVHVTDFPKVFASVKPDAVYLAPGNRSTFHCGPWPFGSDRKSMAKILKASGWDCRPLQPLHGVPGGLMWAVQAVTTPPCNVLNLQHGQVVITSQDIKPFNGASEHPVVGPQQTVQLCQVPDSATDPWLTHDPWKKASLALPSPPPMAATANALQEMEERLEQSILARLPVQQAMEVDDQDSRLSQLEQHFQQLTQRQSALETTVQDFNTQHSAQVQNLQQQMLVQMDMQSKQMQSMLTDQMSRIETILAKKPRTE